MGKEVLSLVLYRIGHATARLSVMYPWFGTNISPRLYAFFTKVEDMLGIE